MYSLLLCESKNREHFDLTFIHVNSALTSQMGDQTHKLQGY